MTKVLPLSRWKKDPPLSEKHSAMRTRMKKILNMKKFWSQRRRMWSESVKQTKSQIRSASNQTQNPIFAYQRNQCGQQCQAIKRQKSGLGHQWGPPEPPSGPPPKRFKPESIEARILPFSKIIREGPTVYYCDHVANVTYKIQCKYPDISFLRRLVENQNWKFPWRKSFLRSKKATRDLNSQ